MALQDSDLFLVQSQDDSKLYKVRLDALATEFSGGGTGAVSSVSTDDANTNDALSVTPTTGAVKIEIKTASDAQYGVVQLADAAAITAGTSGSAAVVDASQLKAAIDGIPTPPESGIQTLTEGGTSIITGALQIDDVNNDVTIGVNEKIFVPFNFTTLPNLAA